VGATTMVLAFGMPFAEVWPKYFVGDAPGVLVVARAVLALRVRRSGRIKGEAAALCVVSLGVCAAVFSRWGGAWLATTPYLLMPCLTWAALRFGVLDDRGHTRRLCQDGVRLGTAPAQPADVVEGLVENRGSDLVEGRLGKQRCHRFGTMLLCAHVTAAAGPKGEWPGRSRHAGRDAVPGAVDGHVDRGGHGRTTTTVQ
jgi:hypothetical protein